MKIKIILLAFFSILILNTKAQEIDFMVKKKSEKHFHKKSLVLNVGSDFLASQRPTADVGLEYGLTNRIGIGLTARYHSFSSSSSIINFKYRMLTTSANLYFHFIQNRKWDCYALTGAGMSFMRGINVSDQTVTKDVLSPKIEYGLGGRYYFTNRVGAFVEFKNTAHSGLQGKLGVQIKLRK